ncbi:hypothetical protein PLICRDRAFT_35161 [Plicaturopsis crispa FD-325 SS-3]|nr:hypothetical protein PLICRDRAFT_35161 [Plicaturopsis crispa FD-325 SS-3]
MSTKKSDILEVENEQDRQKRIQSALEKMNAGPSGRTPPHPMKFDFGDRKTHAVDPPSELLSRVQAFLPQLEASNAALAEKLKNDPQSIDIENIADDAEQVIEMNLGLGVFEERSKSQDSISSSDESSSSDTSESDSSESEDDDSDDSADIISSVFPDRPIRPLPKRTRPNIQVLHESPAQEPADSIMS